MSNLDTILSAAPVLLLAVMLALGAVLGGAGVATWTSRRTALARRRSAAHMRAADRDRAQVAELTELLAWLISTTAEHCPPATWERLLHRLQARSVPADDPLMQVAQTEAAPLPPGLEADLLAPPDPRTSGRHAVVGVDHGDL